MKIKLLILASSTLIGLTSKAQVLHINSLQVNNLKYSIMSNGDIHRGGGTSTLSEFPNGSNLSCVHTQTLWLGGIDQNNELRLAAHTYRQSGGSDFFPGPKANTYDADYDDRYNDVWYLTREEIEQHIASYNTNGYIVPDNIASWPANGDVLNGEAAQLAPYADLNANGIYEPELGDHPLIRGSKALFIMFNDSRENHTESGGQKTDTEVHLMVYAYENTGEVSNDNVVFSHYEIYNRSETNSFSNFYVGSWLDFDIGHYNNDFIGTHVPHNMIYGYNGTASDVNGYGDNPPAFGYKLLNEPLVHSMYYNNSPSSINGNPVTPSDYFNYMQSKWKNGNQLINPIDSSSINFVYPGESDTLNYPNWSEVNSGNMPNDRRMLGSTYIQNFGPGNKFCLDYVSIFARDTSLNNIEQLDHLFDIAEDVQDFYYNQYDDCSDLSDLSVYEFTEATHTIALYQNANIISVKTESVLNSDLHIQVIDVFGRIITQTSLKQGDYEADVELPKVNTGVYFVKCTNKEINQSIKTIIN